MKDRKVTIPTSISRDIWSLKTQGRLENVHFVFAVIEQINIRCTFINKVSCDEQHGLYRIVLTYMSDRPGGFLVKLGVF